MGHQHLRNFPDLDLSESTAAVHSDAANAVMIAFAMLTGLHHRRRTGRGQFVDTSLFEAGVALSVWEATEYWYTGEIPKPLGTSHRMNAPYQAFRASDGHFTVGAANDKLWPLFAGLLGLDHLVVDPRFETVAGRLENRAQLQDLVEEVTTTEPRRHWLARCEEVGIPAGPIYSVPEALADRHAVARGMVQEADHPQAGRVKMLGNPVKLSASPARLRKAAPLLGEDNEALLRELGYGADDVATLRRTQVI
jgi:formyl-CoA transferase